MKKWWRMVRKWAGYGFRPMLFCEATATDLANQETASRLCTRIAIETDGRVRVEVDLSVVESVTEGWARSCFGDLAFLHGEAWIIKNVNIVGARESVLRRIAESIREGEASRERLMVAVESE